MKESAPTFNSDAGCRSPTVVHSMPTASSAGRSVPRPSRSSFNFSCKSALYSERDPVQDFIMLALQKAQSPVCNPQGFNGPHLLSRLTITVTFPPFPHRRQGTRDRPAQPQRRSMSRCHSVAFRDVASRCGGAEMVNGSGGCTLKS